MTNKKRAKKSETHWRNESKQARKRLLDGERMSFEDFVAPRVKQKQATNRLRNA
jgi:hypothetical protein